MTKNMLKRKKGQAAMEFIHTYGWVLATVIILGGAAIYYNMHTNKQVLPKECTILSGIRCVDVKAEENLLTLDLLNEFGFAISNITANITGTCNSTANTTDGNPYNNPESILANQEIKLVFECQNLTGKEVEEKISIRYRNIESDQFHIKVGNLQYIDKEQ